MKLKTYSLHNLTEIPQLKRLSKKQRQEIEIAARVIPFKTNNYVVENLIRWSNYKTDPIFILNFPTKDLLKNEHFEKVASLIKKGANKGEITKAVHNIWLQLNPHPGDQLKHNVPELNKTKLKGIQHKYNETLLFFPTQGQTCHAYCTFCFRWPQFTNRQELKFAMNKPDLLIKYLKKNKQITDILITGGDPMIMSANQLGKYINAILDADLSHLTTIRIGSKVLSYWPYRFISDPDSRDLLNIFKKVFKSGKHLAFMANFSHPVELSTEAVKLAIGNILKTGAQIRSQSPVLNNINASPAIWNELWKEQVKLGIIPYYMFMPRDTGAQHYFAVPLVKAWEIYKDAYAATSGLCRTVRGPIMSTSPGKIQITGVTEIFDEKVMVLLFLQARDTKWTRKPFLAKYNEDALWLDDLKPAFGKKEFFYEKTLRKILYDSNNIRKLEVERYYDDKKYMSSG
ncbi:MAG: lysine 2,3-aminomutase [Bacteroidales bacterium]|nr:MAG: lysine 2,3-aminomutase [Bacteroidales bacterium]